MFSPLLTKSGSGNMSAHGRLIHDHNPACRSFLSVIELLPLIYGLFHCLDLNVQT